MNILFLASSELRGEQVAALLTIVEDLAVALTTPMVSPALLNAVMAPLVPLKDSFTASEGTLLNAGIAKVDERNDKPSKAEVKNFMTDKRAGWMDGWGTKVSEKYTARVLYAWIQEPRNLTLWLEYGLNPKAQAKVPHETSAVIFGNVGVTTFPS
jgi:hypothetical protein